MTRISADFKPSSPPSAEELIDLLTGSDACAVQHLPDVWDALTPQQQTQVVGLVQQLEETIGRLSSVTEEARRQAQIQQNQGAIALLDSWAGGTEEDASEQRETWEYLKRALIAQESDTR